MSATDRPLPQGYIDIHCHLLPAVDDGCRDLDESLTCIEQLIAAGFVGSICTPHVNAGYGHRDLSYITDGVPRLQQVIDDLQLPYRLWTGGELRLNDGLIDFMQTHGVMTLANSRYVLTDFWDSHWPAYVDRTMQWLLDRGYQPILAHPERQAKIADFDHHIDRLADMGVIFQGNANCMVGNQGNTAQAWIQHGLKDDLYSLLALDLHNPPGLPGRLEGLTAIAKRHGQARLDAMIKDMPRQIVTANDKP